MLSKPTINRRNGIEVVNERLIFLPLLPVEKVTGGENFRPYCNIITNNGISALS